MKTLFYKSVIKWHISIKISILIHYNYLVQQEVGTAWLDTESGGCTCIIYYYYYQCDFFRPRSPAVNNHPLHLGVDGSTEAVLVHCIIFTKQFMYVN